MHVVERFAAWAAGWRSQPIPPEVLHHARRAVIDWHAALLPGSIVAPATLLKKALGEGGVRVACGVSKEHTSTDGRVGGAGGIAKKRCLTHGGVASAGGIIQKRRCPRGRILLSSVEKESPSANRCIEIAGGVTPQRK